MKPPFSKKFICLAILFCCTQTSGQNYERNRVWGSDTIDISYINKTGERINYRAFECTKVSKLGIRIDAGFNTYAYNTKTRSWLGNHNGALFGVTIAYGDFNVGIKFKFATVNPQSELDFEGDMLPKSADLNPGRIEYDISYSINLPHNFTVEPYVALTSNKFYVINEDELNKKYNIPDRTSITTGLGVNKYIRLKDFQFLAVFAKYAYGFLNYKMVHSNLGKGYSDMSFGIAYKGFIKRKFRRKV